MSVDSHKVSGPAPGGGMLSANERLLDARQLVVLVAAVIVGRLLWIGAFPIYDDAFITYRYARNFVATGALVYNPGAAWEPVLGTTAPGYSLLLSGLHALGAKLIPASLGLNVCADAVSAVLITRLCGRAVIPSTLAVLGFAALPDLARVSVGGMEAPVLVAVALGAAVARQNGRPMVSGTLAALACSLRPESVLLIGVLASGYLRQRKLLIRFLIPVAVVGFVHAGILTLIYGSPIPQSVAAKAARHTVEQELERVKDILTLAFVPRMAMWAGIPFVLLGFFRIVRERRGLAPFVLFALAIVAAYLGARPKTWGWYYYAPLCAWVLGLAYGVDFFAGGLRQRLERSQAFVVVSSVVILVVIFGLVRWRPDPVTAPVYEGIGRWATDERVVERGAEILASDIGAFGWYADTRILDSQGLVWPEVVEDTNQMDIAMKVLPEYVVLVVNQARVEPYYADPLVRARYRPRWRFNPTGETELEPDLASLPTGWIQDYLVLERVDD